MLSRVARQLPQLAALAERSLADSCMPAARGWHPPDWLRPLAAAQQQAWYSGDPFKNKLLSSSAESLLHERQQAEPRPEVQQSWLKRAALRLGGFYSRESTHMRAAKSLYGAVTEQAANPRFLEAVSLPADFQHTHAMLCLHIWMLLVRLRPEGKDGKQLAQMLYDDFQTDVEHRARQAGVAVRLQKQLVELEKGFYGSSMAYDRALGGKEDLAAALLRNVYMQDESKTAAAVLLANYVRRELTCLTMTPSEALMAGNIKFSTQLVEEDGPGAAAAPPRAAANAAGSSPGGSGAATTGLPTEAAA